jgi:transcriptional regulator with XRE-family HTH domain
MRCYRSIE